MAEPKDAWDKWDIVLKALAPVAVGIMLLVWNSQRTTQQTAAAMTEIAIGILTKEPEPSGSNALRIWAISVLENPSSPPTLSKQAATELTRESLPSLRTYGDAMAEIIDLKGLTSLSEELGKSLSDLESLRELREKKEDEPRVPVE